MESYYEKENNLRKKHPRFNDAYIPNWVKTLIELYTSPLKYEVKYGMYKSGEN